MENNFEILLLVFLIATGIGSYLLFNAYSKIKNLEKKYSKIIDVEKHIASEKEKELEVKLEIEELRASYKEKRHIFDNLVREAAIYNEEIELAELGFYKPHFDFDTSQKFKDQIAVAKDEQKQMVTDKTAIICSTEWSVEGSKAKGRTMTNRGIRLTARAFNNECDSAISAAKWNNIERMQKRIEKAFDAINKLNESSAIKIDYKYLGLKLNELYLTHEYKEKKEQEKEEQAEIRQQMREEVKLEQEAEKALKEEDKYKKLLEKAKSEAENSNGAKFDKLQEKINELNKQLADAHEKSERAKSMAEQTKLGHVYVISNIGSFGENVYKIGMTRRLEPLDRVKELGDASVPFVFDVHAMINSENAPQLESTLHKVFNKRRLNLVNNRKEFFKVSLSEIQEEVAKISPEAEFIETAEARQYRESLAILIQSSSNKTTNDILASLPEAI